MTVHMHQDADALAEVMGTPTGSAYGTATIDTVTQPASQSGNGSTGGLESIGDEYFTFAYNVIPWEPNGQGGWNALFTVTTSSFAANAYITMPPAGGKTAIAFGTATDDEGTTAGISANTLHL